MLSTNVLGGLTANMVSVISLSPEGQRRVTGWGTAIHAEDCPDTFWEYMPKEVPMIFSWKRSRDTGGNIMQPQEWLMDTCIHWPGIW